MSGRSSKANTYMLDGGEHGNRRLSLQREALRTRSAWLLRAAGLTDGDTGLDLGCGGGHTTCEKAEIVGPRGHVTGIDFYQPAYLDGPFKHLGALTLERMRDHGVASAADVDAAIADLHAFADRPGTLATLPRFAQVWGTT